MMVESTYVVQFTVDGMILSRDQILNSLGKFLPTNVQIVITEITTQEDVMNGGEYVQASVVVH